MQPPLLLLRLDPRGAAFPPGRRFSPQQFWCAAPSTQDSNPVGAYHDGPRRPAADFVASGEARMLAWSPPPGAQYVEPHADAQSLVRFLGGLSTAKAGDDPSVGDVVYRVANGSLAMRWPLVFSRLDPFVRNGIQPIIVLDNVPWAFAASNESRSVGYGNNMGPQNVTEYKEFLQVLLQGMVTRYGLRVAQTFWFRVGTEPDTQPKHWSDTRCRDRRQDFRSYFYTTSYFFTPQTSRRVRSPRLTTVVGKPRVRHTPCSRHTQRSRLRPSFCPWGPRRGAPASCLWPTR